MLCLKICKIRKVTSSRKGIGSFTILDDKKVEGSDLGANFFLVSDSMGKSRAEEAVIYLQELNESVKGKALQEVSRKATSSMVGRAGGSDQCFITNRTFPPFSRTNPPYFQPTL